MGMEKQKDYPQLQLQDSTKNIIHITYYGMITDDPDYPPILNTPIMYATQSIHTRFNLPSTIKDPVVTFKIVDNLSQTQFKKVIPLKHCFNLNDKSVLMIIKKPGSQLYPNNPKLKDKLFLVKIVCAKNPELPGNSFAQQRGAAKNKFYNEEHHWINTESGDSIQQLLDAGILEKKGSCFIISSIGNGLPEYKKWKTFQHGPNGCSSDEKLRQSIIDEKIPNNKSAFKSVRNRELTGSFK